MKKSEEVYKELKKEFTDQEIVDSYIFSIDLPKEEAKAAHEEFLKLRFERLNAMSEREIIASDLFAFKLKLKDYFQEGKFQSDFAFSKQLKKYIEITRRSNLEVAQNLGIHKTKLSRLVNDRENPNIDLMYRLEEHSGREIPAFYWWRLYSRELEHSIKTDYNKRTEEAGKVNNPINVRA